MNKFKDVLDAADYMQSALLKIADIEGRYCESTRDILERFNFEVGNIKESVKCLAGWEVGNGIL